MQFNQANGYPKTASGFSGNVTVPLGKLKKQEITAKPSLFGKAYADPGSADAGSASTPETATSPKKARRTGGSGKPPHDKKPEHKSGTDTGRLKNLLLQLLLACLLVAIGLVLLVCTVFVVYRPIQLENDALAETRLRTRMELNTLISEVLPSMGADDEMSEMVVRSLESQKVKFKSESRQAANEIETLRETDELIGDLLTDIRYGDRDFGSLIESPAESEACRQAIGGHVDVLDIQLSDLGVAQMKQEIAQFKGTTTTVTKEDENGETITETVVTGGLIPEAQAKKDELQKQYDEINGKLTALDTYLVEVDHKINAMYSRLETEEKASDVFAKMKAIVKYVQQHPEDNMFLDDTAKVLESFPGESREEDDILFIMKIEAETGISMPTVNYGQDYQLTRLSNGMLLCYEVYSIPYYATYQGLKNLISYFNENDDFYASVYTLSIQYDPMSEAIQGNIVIMHYYLLEQGAEYVPPVIDEEITPGVDGIFGDVTDNQHPDGPMSDITAEQIESWIKDDNKSLIQIREELSLQGYPETELLWILKKKYRTEDQIKGFLVEYGDETVDYDDQMEMLTYLQKVFPNTKLTTLWEIYQAEMPEEESTSGETPDDPEDVTGEVIPGEDGTIEGVVGEATTQEELTEEKPTEEVTAEEETEAETTEEETTEAETTEAETTEEETTEAEAEL